MKEQADYLRKIYSGLFKLLFSGHSENMISSGDGHLVVLLPLDETLLKVLIWRICDVKNDIDLINVAWKCAPAPTVN